MRDGYSCRRIARELGIAISTALEWRYRILDSRRARMDLAVTLNGIVEADETFFRRSFKESHFNNTMDPDTRREAFFKAFRRYPRKHG